MNKKQPKTTYRIRNWPEYTTALVERGNIFLWISSDVQDQWYAPKTKQRGRPRRYSDSTIQALGVIRTFLCLPLRAVEGLASSILRAMSSDLPVPDFSTISRRLPDLSVDLARFSEKSSFNVVLDSSGLKVFGEGEWKVRKHGASKRRTWRKFHIAVDPESNEVLAVEMTGNDVHDSDVVGDLFDQIPENIVSVGGDGAYDTRWVHRECATRGAQPIIVPRRNARRWSNATRGAEQRNAILARIRQVGRAGWKRESGYHRRSLAETAMFRMKTIFGDRLASRRTDTQRTEVFLRIRALNTFTKLGMPQSYPRKQPETV